MPQEYSVEVQSDFSIVRLFHWRAIRIEASPAHESLVRHQQAQRPRAPPSGGAVGRAHAL